MLFTTLLGAAAIVGAQANGDAKPTGYKNGKTYAYGDKRPDYTEYHETNPGCPNDVEVKLSWHGAADLDLHVEGPGMCKINADYPLSKWGGILWEDVIPGYCKPHKYEEVVKYASGVANGGIYKIEGFYYDDGGCHTGHVDYHITVHMGGHEIETFSGTLNKGEYTEPYYVLGFRSGYGCDKRPEKPYPEPKHPRRRDDKGGRRHLLNGKEEHPRKEDYHPKDDYKKDDYKGKDGYEYGYEHGYDYKCPCFKGKVVHERGTCEMGKDDYDGGKVHPDEEHRDL